MKEELLNIKLEIENLIDQMDGNEDFNEQYIKGYIDSLVKVKNILWWKLKDLN